MTYRDLLAEAARRRDAEERAKLAEAKLKRIKFALDAMHEGSHSELALLETIRGIVEEPA